MLISHGRDPHIQRMHQGWLKPSSAGGQAQPWPCLGLSWQGEQPWEQPELSPSMGALGRGALQGTLFCAFASCAAEFKRGRPEVQPHHIWGAEQQMLHRDEVQVRTGAVK